MEEWPGLHTPDGNVAKSHHLLLNDHPRASPEVVEYSESVAVPMSLTSQVTFC